MGLTPDAFMRAFERSRLGKQARSALVKVAAGYQHGRWLEHNTLTACYHATRYAAAAKARYASDPTLESSSSFVDPTRLATNKRASPADPFERRRQRDREFAAASAATAQDLARVAIALLKHRAAYDMLIGRAAEQSGIGLVRRPPGLKWSLAGEATLSEVQLREAWDTQPTPDSASHDAPDQPTSDEELRASYALGTLLDALASVLTTVGSPTRGKGPWLHRSAHGCLKFPEAIDIGRTTLPSIHSMLVLQLVFLCRKCSLGNNWPVAPLWQTGEPLPKGGKSHYDVCVALADAALANYGIGIEPKNRSYPLPCA